jgi:FAD/FMN-containing dehydrogenase
VSVDRGTFLRDLTAALRSGSLLTERAATRRFVRDNSWLSPVLAEHFVERRKQVLEDVAAVVSPRDIGELRAAIGIAARHGVPITPRGRGTSNFGQSIPLHGGMLLDLTRLDRILELDSRHIRAEAGAIVGTLAETASRAGSELTVMTTTYAGATVGGWIAGGHVGIGSGQYGTVWDGNVVAVRMLTAEDPPRELTLEGDELIPVLHAAGTTGVIVEATLPLVPLRNWQDGVVAFPTFEAAASYVGELARDGAPRVRAATAVDATMAASLRPIRTAVQPGESAALLIVDAGDVDLARQLAKRRGGRYVAWSNADVRSVPVEAMVFGHRLLWNKKQAPDAAFLHVYLVPGRELHQLAALDERFGERIWRELKFVRSPYLRRLRGFSTEDDLIAACVLALVPGERAFIDEAISFCEASGIGYLNPHTFVLEESGLFANFDRVVAFKRAVDPHGLLNPGKIGQAFYAAPGTAA